MYMTFRYLSFLLTGTLLFPFFKIMQCSIDASQVFQTHSLLQIELQERVQSLQMQINSSILSSTDISTLSQLIHQLKLCRIAKGDQLVKKQSLIIGRQQKEKQLGLFQQKINQQRILLDRKEQDIWEHKLEGKRIKNIALHRQSLNLFDFQANKLKYLMKQLKQRNSLLSSIQQLKKLSQLNKQNQVQSCQKRQQQTPFFDFRGIDTKVLASIQYEQSKFNELKELQQCLQEQLAAQNDKKQQLTEKYLKMTSKDRKYELNTSSSKDQNSSSTMRVQSSKTVSTEGDEPSI